MARIEGVFINNYRVLKSVILGNPFNTQDTQDVETLTPITAVIGKNGVGKSCLLDAFGFLADCLKSGVEEACDARGGFERLRSQGSDDPIWFLVCYREDLNDQPITYWLFINLDDAGRPHVSYEVLHQRGQGQESGQSFFILGSVEGQGWAWKRNAQGQRIDEVNPFLSDLDAFTKQIDAFTKQIKSPPTDEKNEEWEAFELEDSRTLAITTLGAMKRHPRIAAFRRFIEGWYLSYFTPDAAHGLPLAGPQPHLNVRGDNLANVVQFMQREHRDTFDGILQQIAGKVPGIDRIDTQRSIPDGRLLLRFTDRGFTDPFYAQQMSDGTLKLFAYLLLLADPTPPPFICIEEPENGLYHKLLEVLVAEFRRRATGAPNTPQIFVTTHQPYLIDALGPEEVWILEKGADGFATISRASDDPTVKAMADEGMPLGGLWYSDYLDKREPSAR